MVRTLAEWGLPGRCEEIRARPSRSPSPRGILGNGTNRVCGFRLRQKALGSREAAPLGEALVLLVGPSLDHALVDEQAQGRRVAVIPEAAGMDSLRHKPLA